MDWFLTPEINAGKVTMVTMLTVALVSVTSFWAYFELAPQANAATANTSLTVLNTAPNWTVDAQEATPYATSTPANLGSVVSWVATSTDSSGDNYWLIICSASSSPIAHNSAPPSCGSGFQWAISATTTSAAGATAATTTTYLNPQFNAESSAWFAYICDGNSTGALCNAVVKQGTGTTASPFVINHPPTFSVIVNNGAVNPGGNEVWTATATDTDLIRGGDTLVLYVCKANDFVAASSACGAGGTWATTTIAVRINPIATSTIPIPTQDTSYNAFVYITDNNQSAATTTLQASNVSFLVNTVAPTISSSTISVKNTGGGAGNLVLTVPAATSGPFLVKFTVTDNNSCLSASSTNEISSTIANVYRSGVTQASCQTVGNFNSNQCYPQASSQSQIVCTQDAQTCNATVSNITFTCTFPLWFNADPTDAGSQFSGQTWLASVQAYNWKGNATSTLVEAATGNTLNSFLAFTVTKTSIAYGGLQPGQADDPLATTTDLVEQGNTGLDESLYGDTMCTTWTVADSCDAGGANAGTKIPVPNQKFATSSVSYATGAALTASTSPSTLLIHVNKTTATSSLQTKNTFWGILVPASITLSGNYQGQNTIIASASNFAFW